MNRFFTVLLLLSALSATAQKNRPDPTFAQDWKQADSLLKKGLPKSALEIVNRIYTRARADRNHPQVVKAAMYRLSHQPYSTEDVHAELIESLRRDVADSPAPARNVLQSILAETYWQYYERNRWKFQNRRTDDQASADPRTWDLRRLVAESVTAYEASLKPLDLLRKTPVSAFDLVIEKGDAESRLLRPTLYDFLAHRALAFYRNTEPDIIRPANRFALDQPAYLADAATFLKTPLTSSDTLSLRFRALQGYQRLMAFHEADANPLPLAVVDAARLAFVHQYSTLPNKDLRYQQALEQRIKTIRNQPAEPFYGLALVTLWGELSNQRPTGGWRRRAAELSADLLKRFPQTTPEINNLRLLLDQLRTPLVSMQVEEGNAPNQPIRASVTYQNVPTLYYRLVQTSVDDQNRVDRRRNPDDGKGLARQYLKRPVLHQGSVSLPDDGDLQSHRTEIALPALSLGHYVVLVANKPDMSEASELLTYTRLHVTNIGYLIGYRPVPFKPSRSGQFDDVDNHYTRDPKLYVLNRQTGQPLPNARVELFEQVYVNNYQEHRRLNTMRTDAMGGLVIPDKVAAGDRSYRFRIVTRLDTIDTEPVYWPGYQRTESNTDEDEIRALLFTDRAIYRPGQPIFFKGVLYKGKTDDYRVAAGTQTQATLVDVNGETVSSLTLTSNAFGTVDGQFTAPTGRLTGDMSIRVENSQTSVRVEEYKRPTFEVKAAPLKGSYKLGQPVAVTATAKTFAGAVVDGASVRYRVTRQLKPRWIWWEWSNYLPDGRQSLPVGPETEIANGTLTTDATGAVSLTFVAQPDSLIGRQTNPTFNFVVTIDVTDATGETRSTQQRLSIGYSALTATLNLPPQLDNRDQSVSIRVTNAGGERVPVSGQLTLSPLTPPRQPLRKRLWEAPDRYALSREAFKKLFPADVYADEDKLTNWPKGAAVETVSINQTDMLKLALSRYPAGIYAADLRVTDAAGESATLTQYVTITTEAQPFVMARPDGWVKALHTESKPGQSVAFLLGGGPGPVLMRVANRGVIREERWLKLTDEPTRVEVPITSDYQNGISVWFTRVQNGRKLDVDKSITLSKPDRRLRIETLTFRDLLKPGQAEQWTLRISGPGNEQVLSELVATLYDASLDAFVPLDWPSGPESPILFHDAGLYWLPANFKTVASNRFWYDYRNRQPSGRRYDALAGFGVDGLSSSRALQQSVSVGYGRAVAPRKSLSGAVAKVATMEAASDNVVELREAVAAETPKSTNTSPSVSPRRNFSETAFFFPKLQTDAQGRVLLSFTMPEALTRWRLLAFAHTPDLKTGSFERTVVTQKELMITGNLPRFLREGDTLRLTARINNLSDKVLSGTARIDAVDPVTGQLLTTVLFGPGRVSPDQAFTAAKGLSAAVAWTVIVPPGLENITFRVSASAGDFTDAEERTVPVLPNRMLVLDSQPFYVNGGGKKEVRLNALASHSPELPLSAERLTVELTSNPVWTALQSLPYLNEFPYECAEQLFSRFYANALASHIVSARPDIRAVANAWAKKAPANPLETNPELKSVTLDETPWRRDARDQTRQQAQIGRFLQADNLLAGQEQALRKLQLLQATNGGFVWFAGMPIDRTVSLHLLAGFGHLARLGVTLPENQQQLATDLQTRALPFVDETARQWVQIHKQRKQAGYDTFWAVQYLYARSFYPAQPMADKAVREYMQNHITKNWQTMAIQEQALTALALHRLGDRQTPVAILKSLGERAAQSDELGMYWPANKPGYAWQQAPIETQALLIEAFQEILNDTQSVNAMKQWLLSQKRTQAWPSTKATTEAIYALLLNGDDWLNTQATTELRVGGRPVDVAAAGPVGYQKVTYQPAEIKPELGVITVSKTGSGPAWGGIYYQHFEPLDRVTPSSAIKAAMGNLTVTKQLFLERDSPAGPVSTLVTDKTALKPGDRLRVRLEVRTDRDMQYVHLKDSRASGFEPAADGARAVLSGYRYQNGLGYYEAPRDASTDFYLDRLPTGTHVFEYGLRVVHTGDYASGVATIQCFYAPEFSARSVGTRVHVPAPAGR
ncbi:alpha-2-macroglobulin [Spirosoma sp. 209]|uniref:alpha-2-macroglobulin family protein n=1 Tax=Spirosoma sp. 209 TaxID=1955701 RepID=UPI00098D21B8|nr:alpha-2-macroglobulin family protein [Spirosoma sp. 209]